MSDYAKKKCWFELEIAKKVYNRKQEYYNTMDGTLGYLWKIFGTLAIGGLAIESIKKRYMMPSMPCLKSVTPFFIIGWWMTLICQFPLGGHTYTQFSSYAEKGYMRKREVQRLLTSTVSLASTGDDEATVSARATNWAKVFEEWNNSDRWSTTGEFRALVITKRERNRAIYEIMCEQLDAPPSLTLYESVFGKDNWQAEKQALYNKALWD